MVHLFLYNLPYNRQYFSHQKRGDEMYARRPNGKVEICGINTSQLKTLSDAEKRTLLLRVKAGDTEARETLILGNLRLVLSIVGRFSGRTDNADDLFQVGCIGLMKAIDHFNTDLDVKFSTYAVPMIVGEVRRYFRDNNAIRVSRSVRDMAYRALQAREELAHATEKEPSVEDIAAQLHEAKETVAAALESIVEPVSLFESVYNDGDDAMYVIDQLKDPTDNDETWIETIALQEALNRLGERERHIVNMRFYKGRTQMEIASEIGISQAQVSRLEKSAIEKIRMAF